MIELNPDEQRRYRNSKIGQKRCLSFGIVGSPGTATCTPVSGLAMKRGPSVDFGGYWQRHIAPHEDSAV